MSDNKEFTPLDAALAEDKPVKKEKKAPAVDVDAFIERRLKAINQMTDEAKARRLAERVMRHR